MSENLHDGIEEVVNTSLFPIGEGGFILLIKFRVFKVSCQNTDGDGKFSYSAWRKTRLGSSSQRIIVTHTRKSF